MTHGCEGMERREFGVLVKAMKAVWTDPKFLPDQYAFDVWFSLLKDLPYDATSAAVQQYMLTQKFPPSIAEVRKKTTDMLTEQVADSGEAWRNARNAVHRFGYMRADEALASLDETTAEAVRRIGYQDMCDAPADENGVLRAHFMRIYEQVASRNKENNALPESLRQKIAKINEDALLIQNPTLMLETGRTEGETK